MMRPGTALAIGLVLASAPPAAQSAERDAEGWKTVAAPRRFDFPRDHAAHEDYRLEWWYYTGNLAAGDGRPFGFELTFFRAGVDREPVNPSRWAVRDLYIAHFAISDISRGRFHFFERLRRGGIGWAGASTDRLHVWIDQWQVRLEGDDHLLEAGDGDFALALRLSPRKPPVLQGDAGLSQKGPSEGNASYYYSITRMETTGSITAGGRALPVTGWSWMDREFSSSFLETGQQGWDWMSIQLDGDRELMIYQIRRPDGAADVYSSGTIIDAEGRTERLRADQFQLIPGRRWRSPRSGAEYPVEWTVRAPGKNVDLRVRAALSQQEMNTMTSIGIPYWEGAILVEGTWSGTPTTGRGYLEMTGYQAQKGPE